MRLPSGFAPEKAGQFFNLITAWDLLAAARIRAGDWLALTAGNSSVSMMALQFAKARGAKVISIVRRPRFDLRELGAAEVITLGASPGELRDRVMRVTGGNGLSALVDNVGGPATGELIRSMAFGGQVVINGGMSPDRFELHNFDVLLNGIEIRSHVYRYFFTPPGPKDVGELEQIAAAAMLETFKVPVGGRNELAQFRAAIAATLEHPEQGKQFFELHGLEVASTTRTPPASNSRAQ
jgi:NADPH:quinone reductase-like Zn-dependent oxidoreductase